MNVQHQISSEFLIGFNQITSRDVNDFINDKKIRGQLYKYVNQSKQPMKFILPLLKSLHILPYFKRFLKPVPSVGHFIDVFMQSKSMNKRKQQRIALQLSLIYHLDGILLDLVVCCKQNKYIIKRLIGDSVQNASLSLIITNKIYDNKIPKIHLIYPVKQLYKNQVYLYYQNQIRYIIQFLIDCNKSQQKEIQNEIPDEMFNYYIQKIEYIHDEQMINTIFQLQNTQFILDYIDKLDLDIIQQKHIDLYRLALKNNTNLDVFKRITHRELLLKRDLNDIDLLGLISYSLINNYSPLNMRYVIFIFLQGLNNKLQILLKHDLIALDDMYVQQFDLLKINMTVLDNIVIRKGIIKIQETIQTLMYNNRSVQNEDIFQLTGYLIDHYYPHEQFICDSLIYNQNVPVLKKCLDLTRKMFKDQYNQDIVLKDSILMNIDQDHPNQVEVVKLMLEYGFQSSLSALHYSQLKGLNRDCFIVLISSLKQDTQAILHQIHKQDIKVTKNDQLQQGQCQICLEDTSCYKIHCKTGCINTLCEICFKDVTKCIICKKDKLIYYVFK